MQFSNFPIDYRSVNRKTSFDKSLILIVSLFYTENINGFQYTNVDNYFLNYNK